MKEAHVRINIDNMNEAKEKAAELAETLEKAKVLITQLNEMQIIMLDQMADLTQEQ